MNRTLNDLNSHDNPFGAPVLHKDITDSTMIDAKNQADGDCPHGTVCLASYQAAGRGRVDSRKWASESGDSLMMTVVLEPGHISGGPVPLPLRVGLALARYLEHLALEDVLIKWPNDVLVDGKKIAGILCEGYKNRFLAGMGLNLNQRSFPEDFRRPAISLGAITGRRENPADHFGPFLSELKAVLSSTVPVNEITRRLYGLGGQIEIQEGHPDNGRIFTARLAGLSSDGSLQVEEMPSNTVRTIYSGEILRYLD